jgi:hypothetical protein
MLNNLFYVQLKGKEKKNRLIVIFTICNSFSNEDNLIIAEVWDLNVISPSPCYLPKKKSIVLKPKVL